MDEGIIVMDRLGKVLIVILAYQHEKWIWETLESVAMQDYQDKELVIIDNGSTDGTPKLIRDWLKDSNRLFPIRTIRYEEPQLYCSLFNDAIFQSEAKYVVDIAGDDLLYPDHLSHSIHLLSRAKGAAFCFSDAHILTSSDAIETFYRRNSYGELRFKIEQNSMYEQVLRRETLCAATLVFDAGILRKEHGYDENLLYEEFDIQVRLTRKYPVIFSDHVGVLKRSRPRTMTAAHYIHYSSRLLPSFVAVCEKALKMNRSAVENSALRHRINRELKRALWAANFPVAEALVQIGKKLNSWGITFWILSLWTKVKLDLSWFYEWFTLD